MADQGGGVVSAVGGTVMAGVLISASALALGPPNLTLAGDFIGGAYPSMPSALAFLSLLCYTVALGGAGVAVAGGMRMAIGRRNVGRSARAVALVLAGVVLLGLSVVNRLDTGGGFCCGGGPQQVREAVSLAR